MQERIEYLDFLKGIMIILVVMFHVVILDVTFPNLRAAVYTFHIPVFFIISGYLSNINKKPKLFFMSLLKIVVPYLIFELIYLLMLGILGKLLNSTLSLEVFSLKYVSIHLLFYPIGVFWYLHALILCNLIYYLVFHYIRLSNASKFIILSIVIYAVSFLIVEIGWMPINSGSGFVWGSVLYFLIGVLFSLYGLSIIQIIPSTFMSILPLIILFSSVENFNRDSLSGVCITVFVISFLLFVFKNLNNKLRNFVCYIGRNSLPILLFSPFILPLTKYVSSYFSGEVLVLLFSAGATSITVFFSLLVAFMMDELNATRILFLRKHIYSRFITK